MKFPTLTKFASYVLIFTIAINVTGASAKAFAADVCEDKPSYGKDAALGAGGALLITAGTSATGGSAAVIGTELVAGLGAVMIVFAAIDLFKRKKIPCPTPVSAPEQAVAAGASVIESKSVAIKTENASAIAQTEATAAMPALASEAL